MASHCFPSVFPVRDLARVLCVLLPTKCACVRELHWIRPILRFKQQQTMQIDSVINQDREALLAIAVSTGLFAPEKAESLLGGVIDGLASGSLPEGHQAAACRLRTGVSVRPTHIDFS